MDNLLTFYPLCRIVKQRNEPGVKGRRLQIRYGYRSGWWEVFACAVVSFFRTTLKRPNSSLR